ncbi:MAG: 4a-hydroxytetrahydrobiopterin dehydratase [Psychroflexus halocasei]
MEKMSKNEIQEKLKSLNNWKLHDDVIKKEFTFDDFKSAFAFMTRVAFEAEALTHHPNWENVYNTVKISLNTHDADGITQKDFDLAEKIDAIYK